jgi:hypothetical protein
LTGLSLTARVLLLLLTRLLATTLLLLLLAWLLARVLILLTGVRVLIRHAGISLVEDGINSKAGQRLLRNMVRPPVP